MNEGYGNLKDNIWRMNKEASASVLNGCAGEKDKGITPAFSNGGTNALSGTSSISLLGRGGKLVGLPRCRSSILPECTKFYETLGRTGTHQHDSVSS